MLVGRFASRRRHRHDHHVDDLTVRPGDEIVEPGLLLTLAKCDREWVVLAGIAVPADLEPGLLAGVPPQYDVPGRLTSSYCYRRHHTMTELQAALDGWVLHYNTERPHQSLGMRPPVDRFQLAAVDKDAVAAAESAAPADPVVQPATRITRLPGVQRWVDQHGLVSLGGFRYWVPIVLAGEPVEAVAAEHLVRIFHRDVLVAEHVQRRKLNSGREEADLRQGSRRSRRPTDGMVVTRVIDSSGYLSFAGTTYRVGNAWRGRSAQVAIVADSVQISCDGRIVRLHPIRHDRTKEHGAFATPNGRPRHRTTHVKDLPELIGQPGAGT